MGDISELGKLARLRARTDRQLVALINNELERGLHLAGACSGGDWGCAGQHLAKAERVYADALKLLPKIDDLSESERQRIEGKLRALRGTLDRLPAGGEPRTRTAGA